MEKIGFIGLGIMGKPMAGHLLKAGCELMVYDVVKAPCDELVAAGAKFAEPAQMGGECGVIFLSLPRGSISKDVLFGDKGVVTTAKPGLLVVDTSSVSPDESVFCAEGLEKHGIGFLDCPVSGGEPGAINATLAFMAGGKEDDFQKALPYFNMMGNSAELIGGPGCGSITKLANQIIVNMGIAAVAEAMVLAAKAGANPEKVYKAIRGGLAGSNVLDAKAPMMYNRDFKPGGKISINHKDIYNVISAAHAYDVPVPLSSQLFEIFQSLKVSGNMDDDHSALVKYFERLAGVEVKK